MRCILVVVMVTSWVAVCVCVCTYLCVAWVQQACLCAECGVESLDLLTVGGPLPMSTAANQLPGSLMVTSWSSSWTSHETRWRQWQQEWRWGWGGGVRWR